uniref:Elongation of very long chain fatty acids protein n=1 Tax=Timema poppense TaxID=170557 RepID=A0A7R9DLU9_TIMPO|nr:unnamed protein product [Timema poppensis]
MLTCLRPHVDLSQTPCQLVSDPMLTCLRPHVDLSQTPYPMVDSWLFMSSPVPILTILALYLYFVLSLGPNMMNSREPFHLQKLLVVYNLYQVLFSSWLCTLPFRFGAVQYIFKHGCQPVDQPQSPYSVAVSKPCVTRYKPTHKQTNKQTDNWPLFLLQVSNAAWWYFFSKIIELLDTVFFVLRKKQKQVSFLHVYHHTVTALFSWGYLKFLPGQPLRTITPLGLAQVPARSASQNYNTLGATSSSCQVVNATLVSGEQGVIIGFLNSMVHVVMYSYYMMAAMGPQFQKYLWWKKYITWIQLVCSMIDSVLLSADLLTQFCLMLTYLLSLLAYDCKLPKILTLFFVGNVIVFLYLFLDFYKKAYSSKKLTE